MANPLPAPTNVTTVVSDDKTKITVTWQAVVPAGTTFAVSFLAKDTLAPFIPTPSTATGTTLDITPTAGTTPTASDLGSKYIAQVIAKGATPDTDSPPGLQVYWDAGLSLIVSIGGQSFTLTKPSGGGGIYRLPVSRTNPVTITLDDVKSFADAVGIGGDNVPTKWPNGNPISGGLNLYKLAVDTTNKLFALDIACLLNFAPVPGLQIKEVGLSVMRTDGLHSL